MLVAQRPSYDVCWALLCHNPFTPEPSDQCQNSPAASQEIWHHTVWRTWLFIAYSDEKWLYYKFLLHHSYNCFLKGWENTLFELRSERDIRANFHASFSCAMLQSHSYSGCSITLELYVDEHDSQPPLQASVVISAIYLHHSPSSPWFPFSQSLTE